MQEAHTWAYRLRQEFGEEDRRKGLEAAYETYGGSKSQEDNGRRIYIEWARDAPSRILLTEFLTKVGEKRLTYTRPQIRKGIDEAKCAFVKAIREG